MKNIKIMVGIIIGVLITSMVGVTAATLISSSQIIYKDDITVEASLNNLYDELLVGKEKIATAITDKGVETSSNDTFEVMANNVDTLATNKYNEGYSAGQIVGSSDKQIIAVVSQSGVGAMATVTNVIYYNSDYVSVSNGVFTVKKAANFSFAGASYLNGQAIVNGSPIGSWHFTNSPKVQSTISAGNTFYFRDSSNYGSNHIFGIVWID